MATTQDMKNTNTARNESSHQGGAYTVNGGQALLCTTPDGAQVVPCKDPAEWNKAPLRATTAWMNNLNMSVFGGNTPR